MRRHSLLLLRLPGLFSRQQACEPALSQSTHFSAPAVAEAGPSSQQAASAQHISASTAPVLGLPWLGQHSIRSLATRSRLSLRGSKGLGLRRRQAEASRGATQRGREDEDSLASSYYSRDEPASGRQSSRGRRMQDLEEMPPMDEPRRKARSGFGRAAEELEDDEGMPALSRAQLKAQQKSMRRGSIDYEEMQQAFGESMRGEHVTAPKSARNKAPTPEMGPKASHAEFYGDRASRGGSPTQAGERRGAMRGGLWSSASEREVSEEKAWSAGGREKRSTGKVEGQEAAKGRGWDEPKTLAQLQRQASQALREPRQVLNLIEDACKSLDDMRAHVNPSSPQLTKQVAGVHELLNSVMLRMLPHGIDKAGTGSAQSQGAPSEKAQRGQGPSLSGFHGLEIARCMRLLGKAKVVPPPVVREALINELLEDGCHKLLTASPIAWVQALQGMHLLRSASAAQHYADKLGGGGDAARVALEQQKDASAAEVEAWSVPAAHEGEEAPQQQAGAALAHTSGSNKLAVAEQDLLEVLSSMLVSASGHLEPDTVVLLGSYLAQLFSGKTEVYQAIAATVATEGHRLSDRSGSQLGMMARSLANTKVYVPELLDELAAFVEARKGAFVTSMGWPDLLRAFATFSHPCPGLISLLSDSIHSHIPVLPPTRLSSLALSISLLDKELTPPSLRVLQAVCDAVPSRMAHPDATGPSAMLLIQALAAMRFRDPACLGALAPAATSAWLPHVTLLAQTASQEAQRLAVPLDAQRPAVSHESHHQSVSHEGQQQTVLRGAQHQSVSHDAQQQRDEAQQPAPNSAPLNQPSLTSATAQPEADSAKQHSTPSSSANTDTTTTTTTTISEAQHTESPNTPNATSSAANTGATTFSETQHIESPSTHSTTSSATNADTTTSTNTISEAQHTASPSAPSTPAHNTNSDASPSTSTPSSSAAGLEAAGPHAQPSTPHPDPTSTDTHTASDPATNTPASEPTSSHPDAPDLRAGAMLSNSEGGRHSDITPRGSEVVASAQASIARAQQLAAAVLARLPPDTLQTFGRTSKSVRGLAQLAYTQGTQVPQLLHNSKVVADAGMMARNGAIHMAITTAEVLADTLSSSSSSSSNSSSMQPEHIANLQDALLAFVRCSLGGPLTVSPHKEAPEVHLCSELKHGLDLHRVYDADAKSHADCDILGTADTSSHGYLLSMALSTLRVLGLGQALSNRPGLHPIPPPAGLPAHTQPQLDAAARPVTPEGIFVYMLLGGQFPVQEALYRPPSLQEQAGASHEPMHDPSGEHWQPAYAAGEGSEPAWKSLSPQNLVKEGRDSTTAGEAHDIAEGASHGYAGKAEEEGLRVGVDSANGQHSSSSSSSSSDNGSSGSQSSGSESSGSESSKSESSESDLEDEAAPSGDESILGGVGEEGTQKELGLAGLESLMLKVGHHPDSTPLSPCYVTMHLASTLSSVLLGQGLSTPTTQRLLIAHGRMVLAGAAHTHDSTAARSGPLDSESSERTGSSHGGSAEASAGNSSPELRPESPIAVLLVSPEDFCHQAHAQAHDQAHSSSSIGSGGRRSRHAALLDRVPTGDHLLRRWLLKAAGVRVAEVPLAAWREVVGHEAAAALLISDALREQAGI